MGFDPTAALKTMESRVHRALLDLQDAARDLLDALRNGPAVLRLERERLQDQEVQSALRQVDAFIRHDFPIALTGIVSLLL